MLFEKHKNSFCLTRGSLYARLCWCLLLEPLFFLVDYFIRQNEIRKKYRWILRRGLCGELRKQVFRVSFGYIAFLSVCLYRWLQRAPYIPSYFFISVEWWSSGLRCYAFLTWHLTRLILLTTRKFTFRTQNVFASHFALHTCSSWRFLLKLNYFHASTTVHSNVLWNLENFFLGSHFVTHEDDFDEESVSKTNYHPLHGEKHIIRLEERTKNTSTRCERRYSTERQRRIGGCCERDCVIESCENILRWGLADTGMNSFFDHMSWWLVRIEII